MKACILITIFFLINNFRSSRSKQAYRVEQRIALDQRNALAFMGRSFNDSFVQDEFFFLSFFQFQERGY